MKHRLWIALPLAVLAAALLWGCAQKPVVMETASAVTPLPTATPNVTPTPTATPEPTATPAPTPYTIVWMSDTQEYASTYPDIYNSMMQYVSDKRDELNIVYLLHTGDLINNAYSDHDSLNAAAAFKLLPDDLPVLTVCGNHDLKRMKNRFGYQEPDYSPYLSYRFDTDLDPAHETLDGVSHYALFSAGGQDFVFLSIGYGVEEESVAWANGVLEEYRDRIAVLCTHSYMHATWKLSGPGEILFEKVVKPNENIRLVLCGHLPGAQRAMHEIDVDGDRQPDRVVPEILFNYQYEPEGGHGYLRLLTVDPLTGDIHVTTYSPWLDDYEYRAEKDTFDLPGVFMPEG